MKNKATDCEAPSYQDDRTDKFRCASFKPLSFIVEANFRRDH